MELDRATICGSRLPQVASRHDHASEAFGLVNADMKLVESDADKPIIQACRFNSFSNIDRVWLPGAEFLHVWLFHPTGIPLPEPLSRNEEKFSGGNSASRRVYRCIQLRFGARGRVGKDVHPIASKQIDCRIRTQCSESNWRTIEGAITHCLWPNSHWAKC